jgi:hypothetical protein
MATSPNYEQFNVNSSITVPQFTIVALGSLTPEVLGDFWKLNPTNANQLLCNITKTSQFTLQLIVDPYVAMQNHFKIEAHLFRNGQENTLFGMDLISDSASLGCAFAVGKNWTFCYDFEEGDVLQFNLIAELGDSTLAAGSLIEIMH